MRWRSNPPDNQPIANYKPGKKFSGFLSGNFYPSAEDAGHLRMKNCGKPVLSDIH
jgi:hypothetical protein|tara:strand:- start:90609 stop:90773 length:165 start_codon:yes stop_codon:yes gene_type:complete